VCGRSVGIVHLFWVLIVEGSGCFVRYCGVLGVQEYRDRVLFKQKCEFWVPSGNRVEILNMYQVEVLGVYKVGC